MRNWQQELLRAARVARLATVDALGQPHVVPIVFARPPQKAPVAIARPSG